MYLVEMEEGVWLAPWSGDPGRTLDRHMAKKFTTLRGARIALGMARRWRPFDDAEIVED